MYFIMVSDCGKNSRNWEISYSDRTHVYTYTAFQEAFQEDLKYSDFFQDHLLQPQHIGDIRREFIFYGLEKAVLNPATSTPAQQS